MILLAAVFNAPLMGVLKRWPHRLHAVTMEGVIDGWDRGRFQSACGLRGLLFVGVSGEDAAPWPPRIKGMPEGFIRCRDCWETTGKKRPRCQYKAKNS